ncbi:hypothetical protein B0H67DRAFT_606609 [Lasiosphaeris hirsuta]|uniref:Uncharacterized protein n=1 Tax=Lasiosphaeris hirsuta TaxID=260670 RepID=A0AA40BD59_9PEZI|nr:hypothetical protein B0H67DRAFT_606609 [Lasiosphaeris hirsuta]
MSRRSSSPDHPRSPEKPQNAPPAGTPASGGPPPHNSGNPSHGGVGGPGPPASTTSSSCPSPGTLSSASSDRPPKPLPLPRTESRVIWPHHTVMRYHPPPPPSYATDPLEPLHECPPAPQATVPEILRQHSTVPLNTLAGQVPQLSLAPSPNSTVGEWLGAVPCQVAPGPDASPAATNPSPPSGPAPRDPSSQATQPERYIDPDITEIRVIQGRHAGQWTGTLKVLYRVGRSDPPYYRASTVTARMAIQDRDGSVFWGLLTSFYPAHDKYEPLDTPLDNQARDLDELNAALSIRGIPEGRQSRSAYDLILGETSRELSTHSMYLDYWFIKETKEMMSLTRLVPTFSRLTGQLDGTYTMNQPGSYPVVVLTGSQGAIAGIYRAGLHHLPTTWLHELDVDSEDIDLACFLRYRAGVQKGKLKTCDAGSAVIDLDRNGLVGFIYTFPQNASVTYGEHNKALVIVGRA